MFAAFAQSIENPQNVLNRHGKRAVLFNPGLVAGLPHGEFALLHTERAFERGENIARDYTIEFLVRLSGRKQIEKALKIGIQKGTYVGVMADESIIWRMEQDLRKRCDSLLHLTKEKEGCIRDFFEVSGTGKELQKNIFEKIALLSV
jgi:KEOPS complex subunit Cgi121